MRFMMGQVPKPEPLLRNESKKLLGLGKALGGDAPYMARTGWLGSVFNRIWDKCRNPSLSSRMKLRKRWEDLPSLGRRCRTRCAALGEGGKIAAPSKNEFHVGRR